MNANVLRLCWNGDRGELARTVAPSSPCCRARSAYCTAPEVWPPTRRRLSMRVHVLDVRHLQRAGGLPKNSRLSRKL